MLRNMILLAAISSSPLLWPIDSRAQDISELPPRVAEELRMLAARAAQHVTVIKGRTSPEKISLADQMKGLLPTIAGAPKVSLKLTFEDKQLLQQHASQERETIENMRAETRQRFKETCVQRQTMDVVSLAGAFQRLDEEEDLMFSTYYRSILDALSPRGRAAVLQYLASEIAPHTVKSSIDYIGLATNLPEQVTARVAQACTNEARSPAFSIGTIER